MWSICATVPLVCPVTFSSLTNAGFVVNVTIRFALASVSWTLFPAVALSSKSKFLNKVICLKSDCPPNVPEVVIEKLLFCAPAGFAVSYTHLRAHET